MIRIAICDDSSEFTSQITHLIDHWNTSSTHNITTEQFRDGDSLLSAHKEKPFDIILLDILMPLLNGIDTARELREKDRTVKIVFITSSVEFAVDSYTVKASNYLLKPVNPVNLFSCLDELISELHSITKCIIVKGMDATHRIPLTNIEYVEAQRKHVVFFLKTTRRLNPRSRFTPLKILSCWRRVFSNVTAAISSTSTRLTTIPIPQSSCVPGIRSPLPAAVKRILKLPIFM